MGVAPPSSLVREVVVAVAVAVVVVVAASAGVGFIDSSDGIHIVQQIVLEDGTDGDKSQRTCRRSIQRACASSTP
jgi:hypothetical protein